MPSERGQEALRLAEQYAQELQREIWARQDPSEESVALQADQGQALRMTLVHCTTAIVAAIELASFQR
jgi:hypothetical protein